MSYQPEQGDRVRVVLEGDAFDIHVGGFAIGHGANNYIESAADHVVSIEKLEDPEPPVGSVVLDVDGDAVQRTNSGWVFRTGKYDDWAHVQSYGPLKIIHTPESK